MRQPEKLVMSPLIRAVQTAEILVDACGYRGQREISEALLPGANPSLMIDFLQAEILSGTESVVLVGHQPHLGDLLGLLVVGSDRVSLPLKKGMLAGVDVRDPQVVYGRLLCVISQKASRRLGEEEQ